MSKTAAELRVEYEAAKSRVEELTNIDALRKANAELRDASDAYRKAESIEALESLRARIVGKRIVDVHAMWGNGMVEARWHGGFDARAVEIELEDGATISSDGCDECDGRLSFFKTQEPTPSVAAVDPHADSTGKPPTRVSDSSSS